MAHFVTVLVLPQLCNRYPRRRASEAWKSLARARLEWKESFSSSVSPNEAASEAATRQADVYLALVHEWRPGLEGKAGDAKAKDRRLGNRWPEGQGRKRGKRDV